MAVVILSPAGHSESYGRWPRDILVVSIDISRRPEQDIKGLPNTEGSTQVDAVPEDGVMGLQTWSGARMGYSPDALVLNMTLNSFRLGKRKLPTKP